MPNDRNNNGKLLTIVGKPFRTTLSTEPVRHHLLSCIAACSVSIANAAACCLRVGNPPTAQVITFRVIRRASSMLMPSNISARTEPQASVAGQP